MNVNIGIAKISNGFIVSDNMHGDYIGGHGEPPATIHYPTLDDLVADAGRFVRSAVETQEKRIRDQEERMAAEEARYAAMDAGMGLATAIGGRPINRGSFG